MTESAPPVSMPQAAPRAPFAARDVLAGLTLVGLLLPEAVAYASLAGLPPAAGVIGTLAGLLIYGLIGTSPYAIVSPTSSSAAVLAAATLALAGSEGAPRIALASLLVTATGAGFVLAGAARFGAVSNLIARPVLRGYAFGLALVIIAKQWGQLVAVPAHGSAFLPVLAQELGAFAHWHLPSLALGLAAILVLALCARFGRLPGPLVVIVAGIAGSGWLSARGVESIGALRLGFQIGPWTEPPGRAWLPIVEYALALLFILYAESYSSIRTYALKHGRPVAANRDLIALGVANVLSGLAHGTPVGAGYSVSSANEAAGAGSRLAGLAAAGFLLAAVLTCVPLIERIPLPVLGAIVIQAVSGSLRPGLFRPYLLWHRDRGVALMAVVAVLAFGVLDGLLAAIAFSLAVLLRSLSSPRLSVLGRLGEHDFVSLERYPAALVLPGVLILRPEEPLLFANVDPLLALARRAVAAHTGTHLVILSLEESPDLDGTCVESLLEFLALMRARAVEVRFARLKDRTREVLERAVGGEGGARGGGVVLDYSSVDDAVRGRVPGVDSLHQEPPQE